MYGKSIKCDMCDHSEMLPSWPEHSLGEEFPGWIRISLNQPIMYTWYHKYDDAQHSLLTDAFDCCSIGCAQDVMRLAIDMIPTPQDAPSE